ncbi:MAG: bifunctional DNA-formamidopyrimidine glycosylase/DNA-(apurinic or apyrimidinic site) lyase [Alphaproteobacteria bacterium]|nr:bifunctional DNA-formamidopyrimidine glycosylase/DNA-(apurinic or apyrimidinic site) lyase [Alphaproteobacteria bacterium]
MPELPEVETVMRGLSAVLVDNRFVSIEQRRKDLRFPLPKNMADVLCGEIIIGLSRRAKYILIHFKHEQSLIVHLGMSGRMVIDDGTSDLQKHDHVIFHVAKGGDRRPASLCERSPAAFEQKIQIKFNDPRRFGMMDIVATANAQQHKLLKHLGPEPLDAAFTGEALFAKLKSKKIAVKLAIMDQRVVVGVGNIYACEALFAAGIHPERAANTLSMAECKALVSAIKTILKRAIAKGGSSLRDYVQADGELGYFQHEFAVYGRAGKACKDCDCKQKKVQRITQGGRSTFYCPAKQD